MLRFLRRHRVEEHEEIERRLDDQAAQIVDMAKRLVRLEAEVGIYEPIFVEKAEDRETA